MGFCNPNLHGDEARHLRGDLAHALLGVARDLDLVRVRVRVRARVRGQG